jgi:hypothetical protein
MFITKKTLQAMADLRDTLDKAMTTLQLVDADLSAEFIINLTREVTVVKRDMEKLKREWLREQRKITRQKISMMRSISK